MASVGSAKQQRKGWKPRAKVPQRKVFVSFHEELDKTWKDRFVKLMDGWIVDFSFRGDDIKAQGPPNEEILRRIREKHIADATVTVVLIGACTWRRQFVDWEIHASFRCTNSNPRNGLIGIVLPCHPEYGKPDKDEHLLPPRFADNLRNEPPFAKVYDWPKPFKPARVARWIDKAFRDRKRLLPDSSRKLFGKNSKRPCAQGWID